MNATFFEKLGAVALIAGSIQMLSYALAFHVYLVMAASAYDFVSTVLNPHWLWIAKLGFASIFCMATGFAGVYVHIHRQAGAIGLAGIVTIEIAYVLQACKVSWEIFLYPLIAAHGEARTLLRDSIIWNDALIASFRHTASFTIILGVMLFSLALFRSKQFSRGIPLMIAGGALTYAVAPMFSRSAALCGIFILALGCFWLGVELIGKAPHEENAPSISSNSAG